MVFDDKMHEIIPLLENDGVILFPTDTVWGLGCSVFSEKAVRRIKNIKNAPFEQPLVLLASNLKMLKKYVYQVHPRVETLLDYHHKPLTVIYPKPVNLPEFVISSNNTVAFRLTLDPFCQTIIDLLDHPIVSTLPVNTNVKKCINFSDIDSDILRQVDYICNHGRNIIKDTLPSVIISYDRNGELSFVRE